MENKAEKTEAPDRLVVQPCRDPDDPMFFREYLMTDHMLTIRDELIIYNIELGRGGHGNVNFGLVKKRGLLSAIKWQSTAKNPISYYNELRFLCECLEWPGFPKIRGAFEDENYRAVAMEVLGPSLETLFTSCNRSFTIKTFCLVADQVISRLEYLHSKGYVHRDMKPENLVIGNTSTEFGTIYLIDFGNSKRYLDENDHHIVEKESNVVGTIRYMSINAHRRKELSRRDDLMALFYILLYFMKGSLPWQGKSQESLDKTLKIVNQLKIENTPKLVKDCPVELQNYYSHVDKLTFVQKPDYDYLRSLFKDLAQKNGIFMDNIFDWTAECAQYF